MSRSKRIAMRVDGQAGSRRYLADQWKNPVGPCAVCKAPAVDLFLEVVHSAGAADQFQKVAVCAGCLVTMRKVGIVPSPEVQPIVCRHCREVFYDRPSAYRHRLAHDTEDSFEQEIGPGAKFHIARVR